MIPFKAKEFNSLEICSSGMKNKLYPLLRDDMGTLTMYSVGPEHGRSYVVAQQKERYIISKGNGLSFSSRQFIHTGEMGFDTWGLLLREDALRDYYVGREVEALGIKTNRMEYVVEIDYPLLINDQVIRPILLQYDVECPYRIADAAFIPSSEMKKTVARWEKINYKNRGDVYLIAADILVGNLRTLHENNILHNAISIHNYSWALELLDFELASSPSYPYESNENERHKKDLFEREIIHTYQVIVYIARVLGFVPDYSILDRIFADNGFFI